MTPRPQLAEQLDLLPHPEGGWFRQTWQAPAPGSGSAPRPPARRHVLVSCVVAPGFDFADFRLH